MKTLVVQWITLRTLDAEVPNSIFGKNSLLIDSQLILGFVPIYYNSGTLTTIFLHNSRVGDHINFDFHTLQ